MLKADGVEGATALLPFSPISYWPAFLQFFQNAVTCLSESDLLPAPDLWQIFYAYP